MGNFYVMVVDEEVVVEATVGWKQEPNPMIPVDGASAAFPERAEFVIAWCAFLFPYSDISTYTFKGTAVLNINLADSGREAGPEKH
ncbi:MAG: hypothetical protein ACWGKN_01375 [Desulfoprunum sp.]